MVEHSMRQPRLNMPEWEQVRCDISPGPVSERGVKAERDEREGTAGQVELDFTQSLW